MIVKELIEKLQELDPNSTVYYADKCDDDYVDFHAMDFKFIAELLYKDYLVVILGDKPDPINDGELVPFSCINYWGMLS